MGNGLKNIILFVAVIFSSFFWFHAQAATENQAVNVNLTVPSGGSVGGGGTGGGPGGSDVPAVISNVVSSTSFTTASISWSASDDLGISSVTFVYGLNTSYGSSGTVTGNYQTSLTGLATGTLYYFKISVVDTKPQTTEFTGTFSTAPEPPDTTPPVISNIQISTGVTTSSIRWDTNESADTQIIYGPTAVYGSNYFDSAGVLSHTALLFNLSPNTTYHFRIISTDSSGNSASTTDATFTTGADTTPPPDVSNFVLASSSNSIVLSWTNPSIAGTPDFSQVRVVRKIGSASNNPSDGTVVYAGTEGTFTDTNIIVNVTYFYTIFSFDTSGNNSPGIFRSGAVVPAAPPTEICGNNIDDNNNGQVDCADTVCSSLPECGQTPPTSTPPSPEICDNGLDDNNNGQVDCVDTACAGFGSCAPSQLVACNNGADDDGDSLVDFPTDPGCESGTDTDEYNPPEPTVPEFVQINLNGLVFLAGNRNIRLLPVGEVVTGLSGANLTVAIPEEILYSRPERMVLRVGDTDAHQFVYNATDRMYYASLFFNQLGLTQAFVEIDYGSNQRDSVGFRLNSLPWGQVVNDDRQSLVGVLVLLYGANGEPINMGNYGELNPIVTDANGSFGWMVPNGNFRISLEKDGYYSRTLSINNIDNNVINPELTLIAQPPELILEIDPDAPLVENIQNIVGALAGQTKILTTVAVQKIQDVVSDPEVKKINEQVVAPTVITVVVAGAVPLISWLDFLPFLRLLFLQPLMLLGWRKREKWGLVYNSLNKLPVDLAMVRLINAENGRVMQSKVTDSKGRFIFMVGPGKYRLQAQKSSFVFPSKFLEGFQSDGQKVDIYHGEVVEVTGTAGITATIPLDPIGAQKKPSRLAWEKFGRKLQSILSVVGILVTIASLYISPKWYIAVLLFAHILLFFVFRKLAMPAKARNWGIVYDDASKSPVSRVVARLFNSQFNKLVDTQITDSSGKYYFLAGDAKYYVTYEHKEYHPQKTDIIDLEGKDAETINLDVKLKKN